MKRRVLLFFSAILLSAFNSVAENNIIVKAGDILVFSQKKSAVVSFDYQKTEVNDMPLEEYIDDKGEEEYKDDWNRWIRDAERMFVEDFNRKSKGMLLKRNKKESADYNIIIKVKTIDPGNTAQGFLPTLSLKIRNGAPVMNGTLMVRNQEGKNICTLTLKNIYGATGLNVSTRLTTLYMELSKKIRKAVNKAVKEDLKRQKEEASAQYFDDDKDEEEDEMDEEEAEEEKEDTTNDNDSGNEDEEVDDDEKETDDNDDEDDQEDEE